jgi:glycerophosphoryl diester phosphodiesterase
MNQRPVIVGHRGAAGLAPENTLVAFEIAYRLGVRWLEIDVRLTRDGWPVVIHDESVDRTTSGSGRVAAMTMPEIRALRVCGAGDGTHVPTLSEALAALPTDARWLIELKADENQPERLVAAAVAAIREAKCESRGRLISFDAPVLAAAREKASDIPLGVLTARDLPGALALAGQHGCKAVMPEVGMITGETVACCRSGRYRVSAWTARTAAQIRYLASLGVDEIITDHPDLALRELELK